MARPSIRRGIAGQTCANGIEVDVSEQRQQVIVSIYQQCVVAAFKQVTRRLQVLLDYASIVTGDSLDYLSEWGVCNLQEQVNVVGHPAVGVQSRIQLFQGSFDDSVQQVAVPGRVEDRAAMISA